MENENNEQQRVEIIPEASLSLITKAEIDVQISTAKAFPRSITQFLRKAMSMATVSEGVAESCAYALPRGGKTLEGPSVRLAEIVVSSYGNVRCGARVIYKDNKIVRAQGICHDLETNTSVTVEVERRITDKTGKTFSDDMIVVTGNAACAIAFRNAVFKVIPAALIQDVYDKVKDVARGTAETLPARREKALNFFYAKGVKKEQICEVLEIKDVNDIDLDRLGTLKGMVTALNNSETTIEELFPAPDNKKKSGIAHDSTAQAIKEATEKAVKNGNKSTEAKIAINEK
jgi:hypothetical protein